MEIKILYDNKTVKSGILAGWGFSCLVDNSVLFDTGEDAGRLLNNMREMGTGVSCVEDIVISHDHWDHAGGLEGILGKKEGIKVYGCPGFSGEFKKKVKNFNGQLVELKNFAEIRKNIFATGTIPGTYKGRNIEEQALVIKTPKGITIVTGCAHPGVIKIVEKVKEKFSEEKLYCVLGGFHLQDKRKEETTDVAGKLRTMGVLKAGPAHCSGEEAMGIFREKFGKDFLAVTAGSVFEV